MWARSENLAKTATYLLRRVRNISYLTVVSPFYGLCEIFEKMTAIYGVLIFQKQPYMVLKQNWRNYSTLANVGSVDYITAENPYTDQYYSIDSNPFDAISVQEYRIQGLHGHDPSGQGVMDQIGILIYNLVRSTP
jgi:hypothetical protein